MGYFKKHKAIDTPSVFQQSGEDKSVASWLSKLVIHRLIVTSSCKSCNQM